MFSTGLRVTMRPSTRGARHSAPVIGCFPARGDCFAPRAPSSASRRRSPTPSRGPSRSPARMRTPRVEPARPPPPRVLYRRLARAQRVEHVGSRDGCETPSARAGLLRRARARTPGAANESYPSFPSARYAFVHTLYFFGASGVPLGISTDTTRDPAGRAASGARPDRSPARTVPRARGTPSTRFPTPSTIPAPVIRARTSRRAWEGWRRDPGK